MIKDKLINKLKELPAHIRKLSGLVMLTVIVIASFGILNIFFGQGDELVKKMKIEEERIVQERKLSQLISSLQVYP